MQNTIKSAVTIFLVTVFVVSCNENKNNETSELLDRAESVLNNNPDSTLIILDSILFPDQLNKKLYYKYKLLQIQGKDKTSKNISEDTIIFEIQKYYKNIDDVRYATIATVYCGRVLQEQNQYEKAISNYIEAQIYAKNIKDNNLDGMIESYIGSIYNNQLLIEKANTSYFKAADYYHKAHNYKNEISIYIKIGNYYNIDDQLDSALYYYNIAKTLADEYKLSKEQAAVNQNIAVVYREKKEFGLAKYYIYEGLKYAESDIDKAKIYINLSKVYLFNKQYDSASYYIDKSLKLQYPGDKDYYLLANTYKLLTSLKEERNQYKEALDYHKEYSNALKSIIKQNNNKAIIESEKRYKLEYVQNENNRIKVQNLETILTLIIIFSIVAVDLFIIIVYQIIKLKNNKKKIAESETSIFELQEMAKIYKEEKKTLRNIVLHNFDILRKNAALQETLISKGDKLSPQKISRETNNILYGQDNIDWDLLYLSMNERHNRLFDKMKSKYPQLDEDEFRICCLNYAKFNSRQIAIIMQLSINTIHNKNTLIRQKLGIPKFGNIAAFLENMEHS